MRDNEYGVVLARRRAEGKPSGIRISDEAVARKGRTTPDRAMLGADMAAITWLKAQTVRACLLCIGAAGCSKTAPTAAATGASPSAIASASAYNNPASVPEWEHARQVFESTAGFSSRAEAVALTDQLALAESKVAPAKRAQLALLAGDMRRRAYRTFHVQTDGREAVEQYRTASRASDGETACRGTWSAAVLEAELSDEPGGAYGKVYEQLKRAPSGPCAVMEQAFLDDLAAYRPDPVQLLAIDQRAAKDGAGGVMAGPDGPVVQPGPDTKTGPATMTSLETFGARDAARVVVQLSGPVRYEVGYIGERGAESRPRLFVDLMETKRGKVARTKDVGGVLEKVRIGSHGDKTRVVLDLDHAVQRRVFFLPEPFRVIIDVGKPVAAPAEGTASTGRRDVRRVVLDPGHGGVDPGAIGPGGLKEKDVVLDIAHRAAPVLSRELGVVTMLTRDDDRYVTLEERTARANAFHADLFVSIHCNASENPEGRGVQSFVLDLTRDEIAMRVAARENATSTAAGTQLGGVLANLRVEALSAGSQRFAALLQQATMASLRGRFGDMTDGGVRSATFFVLLGAQMPATLFEVSFISNPVEESRLATADYRQKLADGIANAVRAYREGR